MEKIKLWYLHCLLDRAPTPKTSLECFVKAIGSIEQYCRECYAEEIRFSGAKFVEIMVVDGCFIIEFFRKVEVQGLRDKDNPVFNTSWMFQQIATELLLLKNQIPWRVLNYLFDMTNDEKGTNSLVTLAIVMFDAFSVCAITPPRAGTFYPNNNLGHLLDFQQNYLLGSYEHVQPQEVESWLDHIPSGTELLQVGVKFKPKEKTNSILDITFNDDGVMEIPQIYVWENTETPLRNLVAICEKEGKNKITSYIVLLDNLINNSKDVDFLIDQKILRKSNNLNTESIASFFNRLTDDTRFTHFLYQYLYLRVNAYYKLSCYAQFMCHWNKWQAILKRDYFNSPWSILSYRPFMLCSLITIPVSEQLCFSQRVFL